MSLMLEWFFCASEIFRMLFLLCVMQNTACIDHIAVMWRLGGVTNLSQTWATVGNSFLNFGWLSVPCSTLIPVGSSAFPWVCPVPYKFSWSLAAFCWMGGRLSGSFLLGRKGAGLVFCRFGVQKWLSSWPGWSQSHAKKSREYVPEGWRGGKSLALGS